MKSGQVLNLNVDNFDILEKLPVHFKLLHQDNIPDYFGYAEWYYAYTEFPAVQLMWPDKNGNYPWDAGYADDLAYNQPQLNQKFDFKFFEAENTGVFSTKQIFKEGKPILYVSHDEDNGDWQFLTGDDTNTSDAMLVTLKEVTKLDPTINQLFNMPAGQTATRKYVGDKWVRGYR